MARPSCLSRRSVPTHVWRGLCIVCPFLDGQDRLLCRRFWALSSGLLNNSPLHRRLLLASPTVSYYADLKSWLKSECTLNMLSDPYIYSIRRYGLSLALSFWSLDLTLVLLIDGTAAVCVRHSYRSVVVRVYITLSSLSTVGDTNVLPSSVTSCCKPVGECSRSVAS